MRRDSSAFESGPPNLDDQVKTIHFIENIMQTFGRTFIAFGSFVALAIALTCGWSAGATANTETRAEIDGLAATFVQADESNGLAAVIIAGSGPTDRNGNNNFGLKTDAYRLLAVELAKAGIGSVRYDKRGVGGSAARVSAEDSLTIEQFADDVVAVSGWLRLQKGVRQLVLIGHSEGGVIALLAADRAKPKALVLLATPGRPLAVLVREQMSHPAVPDAVRIKALPILAALERGESVSSVPDELMGLFRPAIQGFLRSLMKIDPAKLLAENAIPTLVLGGSKDVQVTRADFDALTRARPKIESLWVSEMTHALKALPNGALQQRTYTDPSLPLASHLVSTINGFLKQ
jgi:uncharacterized protein